jgi:hypothetical protein
MRCIVEQEALKHELTRCGVSARKLDDITKGLTDTICVRPEVFQREERTGWSRIIVKEFPSDIPAIRSWFTYDDDKVYIEGVDLLSECL